MPVGDAQRSRHAPLRSFKRRSRTTPGQAAARERLAHRYLVERVDDPARVYGRVAPLVLEVGFGMGEATAELAAAEPERDVVAVEVHAAGIGHLMRLLDERGLTNVRIIEGDAREVLEDLSAQVLAMARVFFPDPWPKARHAKRRLVSTEFLDLLSARLVSGGLLHLATDDASYAEHARSVIDAHPQFTLTGDVPWRPVTKYERRGLDAGHHSTDVVGVRR